MGCFSFITHSGASAHIEPSATDADKIATANAPPSSSRLDKFSLNTLTATKNSSAADAIASPENRSAFMAAIHTLCVAFLQLFSGAGTDAADAENYLTKLCNLFSTDNTLPFDDPKIVDAVFQLRMFH